MNGFKYEDLFQLRPDKTAYRLLTRSYVSEKRMDGKRILEVHPQGLILLAKEALTEVSFYLRNAHLRQVAAILDDPEATDNDRFVAAMLLKNAKISAEGKFPFCQDTGTAMVHAVKGEQVWTGADDAEFLSAGIYEAFREQNFRYSQLAPLGIFEEKNTETNLPAQIEIYSRPGSEYHFLFLAKGGGSANKTYLFQETKAILNEKSFAEFLKMKISSLGTAACPPYHLAVVVGGMSAEANLKCVKLASAGYYDELPQTGSVLGRAFRDTAWEQKVCEIARENGIGAQFGGKHLLLDARVIRLPRHAASCPVGIGVSCSADRNIKAKITADGIFIEKLEKNPGQFLPAENKIKLSSAVNLDLDRPINEVLAQLSHYPIKTRLNLSGTLIVARDTAHARFKTMLEKGQSLPDYLKDHPIFYAGPAKTPAGEVVGSLGPTTAERMDPYVADFMKAGASKIMIAKGGRSLAVSEACKKYGGFYLGTVGGPAALFAHEYITQMEVIDFEDLGMEAVFKIRVKDFPAFIISDDKGRDFFSELKRVTSPPANQES